MPLLSKSLKQHCLSRWNTHSAMIAFFLDMHYEITELSNARNFEQVKINLEFIDISG